MTLSEILRKSFLVGLCGVLSLPAMAQSTIVIEGEAVRDRWLYPFNFTPGTRPEAPVFAYYGDDFDFDILDATYIVQWDLVLPTGFSLEDDFEIVSAVITLHNAAEATWEIGTVNDTSEFGNIEERVMLFAAGFGPTYTEENWTPSSPFRGGLDMGGNPRDPFPRNLTDDSDVSNNPLAIVPWAVGEPDESYTPGSQSTPFEVVFELNVSDATTLAELLADLESGISTWIVATTHGAAVNESGIEDNSVPKFLTSNGAALIGDPVLVPKFEITLNLEDASVGNWSLY